MEGKITNKESPVSYIQYIHKCLAYQGGATSQNKGGINEESPV